MIALQHGEASPCFHEGMWGIIRRPGISMDYECGLLVDLLIMGSEVRGNSPKITICAFFHAFLANTVRSLIHTSSHSSLHHNPGSDNKLAIVHCSSDGHSWLSGLGGWSNGWELYGYYPGTIYSNSQVNTSEQHRGIKRNMNTTTRGTTAQRYFILFHYFCEVID